MKKNKLIDDFFYMNSGSPKPSQRFHDAQVKGGFFAEKLFTMHYDEGNFNNFIKKLFPGTSMILRTNPDVISHKYKREYILYTFCQNPSDFIPIAEKLISIPFIHEIYVISYSPNINKWNKIQYQHYEGELKISAPDFTYYLFNPETKHFDEDSGSLFKNFSTTSFRQGRAPRDINMYYKHMNKIPEAYFIEIYAERYFLQVTLREYSTPMQDFDGFYEDTNGIYHIIEIKQKDANINNNGIEEFGWDAHRLALYKYIMFKGNFEGDYILSEINNREDRNHTAWWLINLEEMSQCISWNAIRNGTLMLPKQVFKKI